MMNPLALERAAATARGFPVLELRYYLDGGKKNTETKERLMSMLMKDDYFKSHFPFEASLKELREHTVGKLNRAVELLNSVKDVNERRLLNVQIAALDPGLGTKLAVHYGLFIGAVQGQAAPELWEDCVKKQGVLQMSPMRGCFSMTEIGHGSNVAGLLTTATFDKASDEFVIDTPSLEATKWWIGGAASTATHTSLYARLIVDGKDYGVKTFLVQLRDVKTMEPLPGIKIGDCGHKMGRNNIDNGWIQFDHVRIPRTQMLMKHTKVSRDGSVTLPKLAQISYGPLIMGRVSIINLCSETAKNAVTIATRYAVVRRQGFAKAGEPETKIIDYVTQQTKLMPFLAQAYSLHFVATEMLVLYRELMAKLQTIKGTEQDVAILESLKEMHATSSGLKAIGTWNTLNMVEQCRQSLGGHGYSSHAGLASLYQDFCVNLSWEGDNTILTFQTARYLVQCYTTALEGNKSLPRGVSYLASVDKLDSLQSKVVEINGFLDLSVISEALGMAAALLVRRTAEAMKQAEARKQNVESAMQANAVDMVRVHCAVYMFDRFKDTLQTCRKTSSNPFSLCLLNGISSLKDNLEPLLQLRYFSALQADNVRALFVHLCAQVRKDVVPLVDAIAAPDIVLRSPFGRHDGEIYNNYFDQVNASNKAHL